MYIWKRENYKRILCTERIFQYFNIDYWYDQSVKERHWVQLYMYKQWYECIILNLSFPHWSTKKIMTVYLYKHRYFFFKYPTQYYVRSKNGIFQPISTKCRLGTKCRSNADWGLRTKHRLRRRSPSAEIREIYFCSWNGPKISYIKVAGWSPYIIARNAIKSKKAN